MARPQRIVLLGLFLCNFALPMYISHSKSNRINRCNSSYQISSIVKKEPIYTDLEVFVKSGLSFQNTSYLSQKKKLKITGTEKKRDDIFVTTELLAYVPSNAQKRIAHYLLPGSQRAQALFLTQPMIDALCRYSEAESLSQSAMTQQPISKFFTMNDEQRDVVHLMYSHFARSGTTLIDVDKKTAFIIGGLDEAIKEEFKNSKEFFSARIMPDNEDKLVRLGVAFGKGALLGSMAAAGVTVCHGYGQRVAKEVMRGAVGSFVEGTRAGITISLLTGKPQSAARSAMANVWNEQEQTLSKPLDAFKEGVNHFGIALMKDVKKEVVREFHNSASDHAAQVSMFDVNVENVLKNATIGACVGALCSGGSALWSINEPLKITHISKM